MSCTQKKKNILSGCKLDQASLRYREVEFRVILFVSKSLFHIASNVYKLEVIHASHICILPLTSRRPHNHVKFILYDQGMNLWDNYYYYCTKDTQIPKYMKWMDYLVNLPRVRTYQTCWKWFEGEGCMNPTIQGGYWLVVGTYFCFFFLGYTNECALVNNLFQKSFDTIFIGNEKNCQNINYFFFFSHKNFL